MFRNAYLKPGTASPIGKIKRVWGRLEDQARASLHVHAAVWVEGDDCPEDLENPLPGIHGITCEAPRHTSTPAHLAWREAVLRWQTHRCWGKCTKGMGDVVLRRCKYDYPRPRTNFIMDSQGQKVLQVIPGKECILPATLNPTTERYVYPCTEEEDEWLSPYVPEWLLANGAAMNIQYVPCGSFLAYIAKYVAKPEPSGRIHVPHGVCQHNREVPRQLHFLQKGWWARHHISSSTRGRVIIISAFHGGSFDEFHDQQAGRRRRKASNRGHCILAATVVVDLVPLRLTMSWSEGAKAGPDVSVIVTS